MPSFQKITQVACLFTEHPEQLFCFLHMPAIWKLKYLYLASGTDISKVLKR